MEKRFVLFLGLSLGILVGYSLLARMFFPAPPVAERNVEAPVADIPVESGDDGKDTPPDPSTPDAEQPATETVTSEDAAKPVPTPASDSSNPAIPSNPANPSNAGTHSVLMPPAADTRCW